MVVKAVLECCQEIPCNPCVTACKVGAIKKDTLTSCPTIDESLCVGCKQCVAACSGQAIFMVGVEDDIAHVTFPYEYLPLPQVGMGITATNRMGEAVCDGTVLGVQTLKSYKKTTLVTIAVPSTEKDNVRFMKRLSREDI